MAWDAPRRHDPLPRALGAHIFFVDELDFHKTTLETPEHIEDAHANMHAQLSPIEEERRFLSLDAPLMVHVTVRFHDPAIRFTYNRTYHTSQQFTPSDRLCRGLLRRIEHCSQELITRKDSDALNTTQCLRKGPKPVRFELSFEVGRQGHSGVWAERSFTSHQKHALTVHSANEVLRSTHNTVGMFLRRHDKGFQWTDAPGHEYFPEKPETFKPSLKGPLDLACVPRSHFIESRQAWEFVPGYSLELSFTSRNPARHQPEISRTLKVDSEQITPLNLGMGEDLLWQAYRSLQDVLDQKKSSFDLEHATCDGFDGVPDCDCQHYEENALNVGLRVVNNLGPVYDHLHRSIQSSLRLFTHQSGQDCDDFVNKVQARLQQFKTRTDKKIERLNDFDFRIAELTGHGWQQRNCARFVIDGSQNHTRRSTQALLDRIRNGVSDVLRGNDVAIRMIAYKRGHLVLDKALVARDHKSAPSQGLSEPVEHQQHLILAELKRRIQQDIDIICLDTCDLDEEHGEEPGHEADIRSPRPRSTLASSRPFTPWETPSPRSHRLGPASPDSIATRSPVSPARSLPRVFPLVPAKYVENKESESTTVASIHGQVNSTISSTRYLSDLVRKELAEAIEAPVDSGDKGKDTVCNTDTQGLKPAAEVYRSSKEDYDTDASSTHSSMPALTESDTPSPDQSLLITPSCKRSSSPTSRQRSSIEDFGSFHFSNSLLMDTSAPSSTTFSDLDRFEDRKFEVSEHETLRSDRPITPKRPSIQDSSPGTVMNELNDASGDEKTPLAHRHMQAPNAVDELVGDRITEDTSSPNTEDNGSETTSPDPILKHVTAETNPEAAIRDFNSGWLLYPVQEEDALDQTANKTHKVNGPAASLAEFDSSETLMPSILNQLRSIESVTGLLDRTPKNEGHGHSQFSVPTGQPGLCSEADSTKTPKQIMEDLEQPWVKLQDEDVAMEVECSEVGQRSMGKSERPCIGHVIPLSDSGIDIRTGSEATDKSGSEYDEKLILSPIYERVFDFGSLNLNSDPPVSPADLEPETASGPLSSAITPNDLLKREAEAPECPVEDLDAVTETNNTAPKKAIASVKLPKVRTSDSGSRSISNPQPSPTHLGLGSAHLLPSLPIFSNFRSVSHETRTSWTSSSSSWEDYVSSVRQSSDSVDTFKPSPSSSEVDELDDSVKRRGTPTAGLLGLNESRWADFGIRTALTGTHVFDYPTTATESQILETGCAIAQPHELHHSEEKETWDRLSSPRKHLLKQKKSIGSLLLANRLKRKESRELKKQKSIELKSLKKIKSKSRESPVSREDEDGTSRFPRAMMLVAGLAFASSVISRNQS